MNLFQAVKLNPNSDGALTFSVIDYTGSFVYSQQINVAVFPNIT